MAPVAGRAHPIKLHSERPHPLGRLLATLIGPIGAYDQAGGVGQGARRSRDRDMQAKDAMGQVMRQVEDGGHDLAAGDFLLGPDFPPKREAFWNRQVEGAVGLPAHDHGPGQQPGGPSSPAASE